MRKIQTQLTCYLPIFLSALLLLTVGNPAFSAATESPGSLSCGTYRLRGRIEFRNNALVLLLSAGSQSELQLDLPSSFMLKAGPYLHETVELTGTVSVPARKYRGTVEPDKIEERVPDPLHDAVTSGVTLIQARTCQSPQKD